MRLLYPSNPFDRSTADGTFIEEFDAAHALGLGCSIFSFEDFEAGKFRARPAPIEGEEILYRGWMLTLDGYARLHEAIVRIGGKHSTSPDQYRRCHHLPGWYALCEDLTPETVCLPRDADFVAALAGRDWPAYFVKDYVKSLTTRRGSVAASSGEVAEVVSLIENDRGMVEGGVCVRKFERLRPETEERYFVLDGRAHGRDGPVPEIVNLIADRIDSPFFSADIVASEDGGLRLIGLGDGQVSGRKHWPSGRFASIFLES